MVVRNPRGIPSDGQDNDNLSAIRSGSGPDKIEKIGIGKGLSNEWRIGIVKKMGITGPEKKVSVPIIAYTIL